MLPVTADDARNITKYPIPSKLSEGTVPRHRRALKGYSRGNRGGQVLYTSVSTLSFLHLTN